MSQSSSSKPYIVKRPGGDIDPKRIFNVPGVVLAVAGATVLFFLLLAFAPNRVGNIIGVAGAVSPARFMLGPEANGGLLAMLSPLIAHMFLHAGLTHLAVNSLSMLAFGAPVARRMGAEGALQSSAAFASASLYLTFYLLCGVAGALFFIALHADEYLFLVGASGGVSGLFGALVRFAFNRSTLFGPENASISSLFSPAVMTWSIMFIVVNIIFGAFGGVVSQGVDIAWEAHIGGFFFGLLTYPYFERAGRAFH